MYVEIVILGLALSAQFLQSDMKISCDKVRRIDVSRSVLAKSQVIDISDLRVIKVDISENPSALTKLQIISISDLWTIEYTLEYNDSNSNRSN
jgi:hypothetical protein